MNLHNQNEAIKGFMRHNATLFDSATIGYVKGQLDNIRERGEDPRDYEVIICFDENPKHTKDGLRITQRLRVVKVSEL